jgi:hypothetical protein
MRWGDHVPDTDTLGYTVNERNDAHHTQYSTLKPIRGPISIHLDTNSLPQHG